jgi:ssDNA-binding Zn-finger/Zn-ribbon topoisomerase 1
MTNVAPVCKKCGTAKVIMTGKRNQNYIGCPKCAGESSPPEPGSTTPPLPKAPKPAKEKKPAAAPPTPTPTPEKKKTKGGFWW